MADTEYSALPLTDEIQQGDGLVLARGGTPYRVALRDITYASNIGNWNAGVPAGQNRWRVRENQFGIEALSIEGQGNVGIGTSAPFNVNGRNLEISSPTYARVHLVSTGGSGRRWWFDSLDDGTFSLTDGTAGARRWIVDPSGNLLVGAPSGGYHRFLKPAATGSEIFQVDNNVGLSLQCRAVDQNLFSLANAAVLVGRNSATGRSINAGGTINASGADYAEYMRKAPGCGEIAKGDVCGVDSNGQLTRKWADAISFVVKSLEPGFVGGDTWGIDREGDELEAARLGVDRIAFCGQVPVNVTGDVAVGDYIIAAAKGSGIKAVAVAEADITFEQYRRRLGKVWAIRDGRPIVDVQHG
jgi:hypothetical protein